MEQIKENNWSPGWLDEILDQAEKEVESWPEWMQRPEYRHPKPKVELGD